MLQHFVQGAVFFRTRCIAAYVCIVIESIIAEVIGAINRQRRRTCDTHCSVAV